MAMDRSSVAGGLAEGGLRKRRIIRVAPGIGMDGASAQPLTASPGWLALARRAPQHDAAPPVPPT